MDVSTQRQADGSGLSRWNLVPANEFVTLLASLHQAEWFDSWYESIVLNHHFGSAEYSRI